MGVGAMVVSAIVGAASAVNSYNAAKDQEEAQKEIQKQTEASNTASRIDKRRQDLRQMRIQQAKAEAAEAASGTGASSGALSVGGQLRGQADASAAQVGGQMLAAKNIGVQQQNIVSSQADAQQFAALASVAQSGIKMGLDSGMISND